MDITLERILSLLPKKPDGSFQHGAKKEFAEKLGLRSGNLLADWVAGRSSSYLDYVYQIAAEYGVSVEWLRGETDIKSPAPTGDGLSEAEKALLNLFRSASPEIRSAVLRVLGAE